MPDVEAYLAAGAVLSGSVEPPDAPLDNGGLRSQISFGKGINGQENTGAKVRRQKKKRRYHAGLVAMLGRMGAGEFGLIGEVVAEKWIDSVKRCPGVVRRHGVCGQDSFMAYSCENPLCPHCQGRLARRRSERIQKIVGVFGRPKLLTFSGGPNQEELTGSVISAIQGAVVAMHRRVYLKERCRGGFRKVEITNHGAGWNVHVHELADADFMPIWPQTDIARPSGTPFTPYAARDRYVKPVNHPGLAVMFTEACQKYSELRADGVRWDGFPVFSREDPASWYIVDVRQVTYSPENEISKYIAKGNQIVEAGGRAVLDYLIAIKRKQLFKGFGHCYNVKLDEIDEEDKPEEPPMKGCCPYEDCSMPDFEEWEYRYRGTPDVGRWRLERNPKTGTSRILLIEEVSDHEYVGCGGGQGGYAARR